MPTIVLTVVAMLAFAGNSILCRLALGQESIDAASFTSIRAVSGAIVLALIVLLQNRSLKPRRRDWLPASMLFIYMACFSFAYLSLSAGSGALILFGAVQITMLLVALHTGERLSIVAWCGFAIAIAGLVWLVSPGLTAPDPQGASLMAGAGVAWGAYSLLGRQQADAVASTARNFLLAAPLTIALSLILIDNAQMTVTGSVLAVASGAATSGLGYVVWYTAVPRLSATQAASVQLTVPLIAALLGIALLAETVTTRMLVASIAILGGVGLVVAQRTSRDGRTDSR